MSRSYIHAIRGPNHSSLSDVAHNFTTIFGTLKHDLEDLKQISSAPQMLKTVRALDLFRVQHKTSAYDSRMNGVAMAVIAFVTHLEGVVGVSETEAFPCWQSMLWGSIATLIKISHNLGFCVEQALHLIELLTLAPNLLRFDIARSQGLADPELIKKDMLQILAEIIYTLGETIASMRTRPPPTNRLPSHRLVHKVEAAELERFQLASERIVIYTNMTLGRPRASSTEASYGQLNLPFNNTTADMLSRRFFGRDEYLPFMKAALDRGLRNRKSYLALHGLPGVGKTQLALRFVERYQRLYDVIIWAAAASEQKIQESLARAAYSMRLPGSDLGVNTEERVHNVLSWLSATDKKWLMVFDNVDDVAILDAFKVTSSNGHVIITSRDPRSGVYPVEEGILVKPFSADDSKTFFLTNVGAQNLHKLPPKLEKWVQEWDGLPMALDQMGSYIRESGLTLQAFSAMYENNRSEVHSMHSTYAREWGYHNTTATAFSIRALHEDARTLLHTMCFMDPDNIFDESGLYGDDGEKCVLLNMFQNQFSYFKALDELVRRSLVHKTADALKVHRLVQAVSFDDMEADQRHAVFQKLLKLVAAAFPQAVIGNSLLRDWKVCERYSSHVEYLLDHRALVVHDPTCTDDADLRRLVSTCIWYRFERGYFSEADRLLRSADTLPPGDALFTASLRFSLASIRAECNRIVEAREHIDQVIAIQERVLRPSDLTLGNTYYSAGMIYKELGDLDKAFELLGKALEVQRLTGDIDKAQAAATHENLCYCYLQADDPSKAAEHAEKACDLSLEACGKQSDHFAEALFDLGNVRLAQERLEDAFQLHQEALAIRISVMPLHDKTGFSLHKMAKLYELKGDLHGALTKLAEAIVIFQGNFDHLPRVARSKFSQAGILEKLGRVNAATKARKEAAEMRNCIKTFPVRIEETEEAYDMIIASWFR